MANKAQKPAHQRQDQRASRSRPSVSLAPIDGRIVPAPPRGIHEKAKDAWRSFWSSPIAQAVDMDADMTAIKRWAHCLSERERFAAIVKQTPLVKGSTGQLRENPLAGTISRLSREIEHFEEHFGMTPLARMRLGIAIGEAADVLNGLAAGNSDDEPQMVDMSAFDDDVIEVGT